MPSTIITPYMTLKHSRKLTSTLDSISMWVVYSAILRNSDMK
jgi:hypothetical protein